MAPLQQMSGQDTPTGGCHPAIGSESGRRPSPEDPRIPHPAWSAGTAAVILGLASIMSPAQVSTFGRLWGVLAIVGGMLFISLAEREAHHKSLEPSR